MYIYIYICIYIYTHIHTYMHTRTCINVSARRARVARVPRALGDRVACPALCVRGSLLWLHLRDS